jgi:virulence-associated protein VapD
MQQFKSPKSRQPGKKQRQAEMRRRTFANLQDSVYVDQRIVTGIVSLMERLSECGEDILQDEVFCLDMAYHRLVKSTDALVDFADSIC